MKLATAIVVLLVLPASAGAVMIDSPNPVYQRWANESRVPTPNGTVAVNEYSGDVCPQTNDVAFGCTDFIQAVWVRVDLGPARATFLHELGHLYAVQHPDLAAPSDERFADAYSLCARRWHFKANWSVAVGEGLTTGRKLNNLCRAIRASSAR